VSANRKKVQYLLVSAMLFASVDSKCRFGLWKTEQEIYHQVWYSKPSENEAIKVKKKKTLKISRRPTQVTGLLQALALFCFTSVIMIDLIFLRK